jgi:Creatinine amidohydrolase
MTPPICTILVLAILSLAATDARAQVLRLAEMDAAAVARLDRARTIVIIPGGILEEHGPHLPVNADGYRNERIAADVAAAVAARPGWAALVLPTVPLGSGSFELTAGRPVFRARSRSARSRCRPCSRTWRMR